MRAATSEALTAMAEKRKTDLRICWTGRLEFGVTLRASEVAACAEAGAFGWLLAFAFLQQNESEVAARVARTLRQRLRSAEKLSPH